MRFPPHPCLLMTDTNASASDSAGHPASDAIAAFVDRCVNDAERDRLLAHFASCAACRREMADVREAVTTAGREQRAGGAVSRRWPVLMVGLAAVLLLAIGLPRRTPIRVVGPEPVTRTPIAEPVTDPASLAVVAPMEGQALGVDRSLRWHTGGVDATYEVTVQDSAGAPIWSASLTDTIVVVPDSARLVAGAGYFWSVDVRRADGSTSRSGVHRFVAR